MNTTSQIARHCVVTGRVQGVFFRRATFQKANALGIKGWVRNLDDGSVECLACGEVQAVNAFCEWLWEGSPASQVVAVKMVEMPWQPYSQFSII